MRKNKIVCSFSFFFLTLAFLLSVVDLECFDRSFYSREYEKNGTAEYMEMSPEDLEKTTDVLLGYLKDERDDIIVTADVAGVKREVFDERETLHMVDVKELYQNALKARNIALAAGVALLAYAVIRSRRSAAVLKSGFQWGVGMIFVIISALAVWAVMDFNAFWISFHELFFDNDLYLLNPNTELLIRMVPETFFFDLVMRIVLIFLAGLIAAAFVIFRMKEEER